ncbi:MAG: peptide deformylase [Candidatus Glassbacteria bacterium]
MALRKIRLLGDPILKKRSSEVEKVDEQIIELIDDMFETMYNGGGVGLAAPQVGESVRVIVLDGDIESYGQRRIAIINPVITHHEGEVEEEEGCLSIPELREKVKRWEKMRVRGLDPDGEELELEAEGILSRAIQHEIDHLNGILFIDRVSSLKRDLLLSQWRKIKEEIKVEERT